MASSSGTSSGSGTLRNSSSEENLQQIMDTRKRKRMLSNRESARRSRMRKQKHVDDLLGQVGQLSKDNNQILTNMNVTTQVYLNIEAENSVLRAQMAELSNRLQSLNDIIGFINTSNGVFDADHHHFEGNVQQMICDDSFMNPWTNNSLYVNQSIMASADMIMY